MGSNFNDFGNYFGSQGGSGGQASNQYFSTLPRIPTPTAGAAMPGSVSAAERTTFTPTTGMGSGTTDLGRGFSSVPSIAPGLTNDFFGFLRSQIGEGATPFNLQSLLTSGGTTGEGQLSAPMNEIISQLLQFYSGGGDSNVPGFNTLQEMSQTGAPIDQTPAWEAMVEAAKRGIDESRANLRESFSFAGNLASSPFGRAETDFESQTAKDLNAQLIQAVTQAQESAAGRRLGAGTALAGGASDFGSYLQGLDQSSIDRLFDEFIRTRPEYSPLINAQFGAAGAFAPVLSNRFGLGAVGGLLGGAGAAASGISDIIRARRGE
ncbi:hypothetical protein LCGC14_2217200 [marine sediment metagenome]|uniref:Uncharacterized protein n=1 Tax=marine sediment metagenome TaxID=412755 RepID=A0A0F9DC35_9ZZZZ